MYLHVSKSLSSAYESNTVLQSLDLTEQPNIKSCYERVMVGGHFTRLYNITNWKLAIKMSSTAQNEK